MNTFRAGFLLALAENGITPDDLGKFCIVKSADFGTQVEMNIGSPFAFLGDAAKSVLTLAADMPLAAAIGIGGATGIGAGYGIHALTKRDSDATVKALKDKEMMDEIELQSEMIKRRLARNKLQSLKMRR